MPRRVEERYPITIYELQNTKTLEEYKTILKTKIENQTKKTEKDSGINQLNEGCEVLFYSYNNNVDSEDIAWHKPWQEFFNIREPLVRNSNTGHGVIIINLPHANRKYALVFGRASSLLNEYYIRDFGINLATRLFDDNTVEVVSSKYFSMIKNKQIIDYKEEYNLQTDEGQAVDFIQARITEDYINRTAQDPHYIEELLNFIKPRASAGYSFVKVMVYGERITFDLITRSLELISNIQNYAERFPLPVMKPVLKAKSDFLDNTLLRLVKSEEKEFYLSVPFYGYDESNRFTFFDEIEAFRLKYENISSDYVGKLNSEDVTNFILENHDYIQDFRELYITVTISGETRPSDCILRWVDADLNVDGTNYALYDGDWVEFNQTYIDCLQRSVEKYEAECSIQKPELSFSSEEVGYYREHYPNELLDRFYKNGDGSIEGVYKEFVYNFALSQKTDWLLFDRQFGGAIEICDIYVRDEQYVHVKIGDSTALDEVFRQSMLGLRYAEQNRHKWNEFTNFEEEHISEADKCSVIFLSANNTGEILALSESKSLRCKMTFIDWVTFIKERGRTPKIYLGFFTPNMQAGFILHENLDNIALN